MKHLVPLLTLLALTHAGCKRTNNDLGPFSSVTVANAAVGISSAKVLSSTKLIPWNILPATDAVSFSSSVSFGTWAGSNYITAVSAADTTVSIYSNVTKGRDNLGVGSINTLFLCGNTGSYEGIFIPNDNLPYYADSVMGIRFINLSPNSTPVSISILTPGAPNEVSNLAYKQMSSFKLYNAGLSVDSIRFIIKNGATGDSLTKFVLLKGATNSGIAYANHKNLTLVVKGLQGTSSGTNALGMFPVPHY